MEWDAHSAPAEPADTPATMGELERRFFQLLAADRNSPSFPAQYKEWDRLLEQAMTQQGPLLTDSPSLVYKSGRQRPCRHKARLAGMGKGRR